MGRGNEIAREETGTLERAMREEQIRTKYNARYDNAIRTPTNFVCWSPLGDAVGRDFRRFSLAEESTTLGERL